MLRARDRFLSVNRKQLESQSDSRISNRTQLSYYLLELFPWSYERCNCISTAPSAHSHFQFSLHSLVELNANILIII